MGGLWVLLSACGGGSRGSSRTIAPVTTIDPTTAPPTTTATSTTAPAATATSRTSTSRASTLAGLPTWLTELLATSGGPPPDVQWQEPSSAIEVLATCGEAGRAGSPCAPGTAARLRVLEPDAIADGLPEVVELRGIELSPAVPVFVFTEPFFARSPEVDTSSALAALRTGGMQPLGYRAMASQHGEPKGYIGLCRVEGAPVGPLVAAGDRVTACGSGSPGSAQLAGGTDDPGFVVEVGGRFFLADGDTLSHVSDGARGGTVSLDDLQQWFNGSEFSQEGLAALREHFPDLPPGDAPPDWVGSAFEVTCDPTGTTGAACAAAPGERGAPNLRIRLTDPEAMLDAASQYVSPSFDVEGLSLSPVIPVYRLTETFADPSVDASSVETARRTGGLAIEAYETVLLQDGQPIGILSLSPDGDQLRVVGSASPPPGSPLTLLLAAIASHEGACCVVGTMEGYVFAAGDQVVRLDDGSSSTPTSLAAFRDEVRTRSDGGGRPGDGFGPPPG